MNHYGTRSIVVHLLSEPQNGKSTISASKRVDLNGVFRADVVSTRFATQTPMFSRSWKYFRFQHRQSYSPDRPVVAGIRPITVTTTMRSRNVNMIASLLFRQSVN